jgi:hypothetical protein
MRSLFLLFLILITLPVHSLEIKKYDYKRYIAGNDHIQVEITCDKPRDDLFKSAKYKLLRYQRSYKPQTIKKYLKTIVICEKLRAGNEKWVRGTYNVQKRMLILEVDRKTDDLEYVFHHEFSSILLLTNTNMKKFANQWIKNNRSNYGSDWDNSSDTGWNAENRSIRRKGFMYPYCLTSFENDFNIIASFYKSDYLRHILESVSHRYPLIKNKYKIIKTFYNQY